MKEIRTRLPDGVIEVTTGADTPVPGLCVARTGPMWTIVHSRSGLSMGFYADPEAALACAIELGELHDWTRPATELHSLPGHVKKQCAAVCRRWGAQVGNRPDTYEDLP